MPASIFISALESVSSGESDPDLRFASFLNLSNAAVALFHRGSPAGPAVGLRREEDFAVRLRRDAAPIVWFLLRFAPITWVLPRAAPMVLPPA